MFKNTIHVPVQGQADEISEQKFNEILTDAELLHDLRKFFVLLTHYQNKVIANYNATEECMAFAQEYFINKRKEEVQLQEQQTEKKPIETDQMVFHTWLVMSKIQMME